MLCFLYSFADIAVFLNNPPSLVITEIATPANINITTTVITRALVSRSFGKNFKILNIIFKVVLNILSMKKSYKMKDTLGILLYADFEIVQYDIFL